MRKYECRRCAKTCTLLLDENLAIPRSCIYGNRESLWCAIKEDSAENEQFGNSEQLPSNPRKWPDWVKVGELGYEPMIGYYKIVNFFNKGKIVQILRFENNTTYAQGIKDFNPYHCEARKRPFNADEMKELVGKVLGWENNLELVISYNKADVDVYVNQMWCSAKYLMDNEYTLDGKPCYILEHLNDKGEWVE